MEKEKVPYSGENKEIPTAQTLREWKEKIKRYVELGEAGETGPEFEELNRWTQEANKNHGELFELAEKEARNELEEHNRERAKGEKK